MDGPVKNGPNGVAPDADPTVPKPDPHDGGGHVVKKGTRLLVLDGLRAAAICLVMIHHYSQGMVKSGFGDRPFYCFANSCWVGVDLFFVLSGFLITGILLDAKGSPSYFRTFYIRRSLRIFPIYYLMLLLVFIILPALDMSIVDSFTLDHGPWFWLYGANYLTGLVAWPDTAVVHLWSLAIEEHFYMLWPFVVFFTSRKQLLVVCCMTIVCMVGMRFHAASNGVSSEAIYVMTHYRIGTLVLGSLLALAWRTPGIWPVLVRYSKMAAVLLFAALAVGFTNSQGLDWRYWSPVQHAFGYTIVALFFVAVHVLALQLPVGTLLYRILSSAPAIWIGRLSYGMYLFHRPIETVAIKLGLHPGEHAVEGSPSWPYELVYIMGNAVVTAFVAWLTWNLFEKHVLSLKDRFVYQKPEAGTAAIRPAVETAVDAAEVAPLK